MVTVCECSVCLCLKKVRAMSGLQNAWLSQEQFMAISIRLKVLNWDKVQLLLKPFWHLGHGKTRK